MTTPFTLGTATCDALFNDAEQVLRQALKAQMAVGGEQQAFAFNLGSMYAAIRFLRKTHSVDAMMDVIAKLAAAACLDHDAQASAGESAETERSH